MKKYINFNSYLSLFIGITLSFLVYVFVKNIEEEKVKSSFTFHSKMRFNAFKANIEKHIDVINFIDGLYESSSHVSREEFQNFIDIAHKGNPNILGFIWSPLVKQNERLSYEESLKSDGFPQFRINEIDPLKGHITTALKKKYLPIHYIEPHSSHEYILGFDMLSDPNISKSIHQAKLTGKATISKKVTLLQAKGPISAHLIIKAIYENDKTVTTTAQRKKHFKGIIVTILSLDKLIPQTLEVIEPIGIDIFVSQLSPSSEKEFVHKHASRARSHSSKRTEEAQQMAPFTWEEDILILGESFSFTFIPIPKFFSNYHSFNASLFFLIGCLISFFLFIHLREKVRINDTLEEKVKKRTYELEIATRAKSQFLANMSHEIRTPLNAIVGFVDLLFKKEVDTDKQSKLKIIKESGQSLLTIINDILDFSKLEHSKLSLESQPYNIKELCAQTISLYFSPADEKNIMIHYNADESIPDFILGDYTRVKQVFSNLLSNAIKFSHENSTITVNLSLEKESQHLRCEIIDQGIGINEKVLKTIFTPFSQADNSTTRKFGGTGLGLSISKTLIELMQGEIKAKSTLDQGSTFYFTLPMLEAAHNKDQAQTSQQTPKTLKGKVLIVEDNKTNQLLLKILLDDLKLESDCVNDGSKAVEAIKKKPYDIILMDENMPILNGSEATKVIRTLECGKDVPIIAVTANALKGDKEKFIASGMNDYLSKPINPEKLYEVLSHYL